MAEITASLRALLARSIDYAGLFPPCNLELERALTNQAAYVRSEDSWMLSSFVLPIAKFADAAPCVSQFGEKYPLRISALGPKTTNATDFLTELKTTGDTIRRFTTSYRGAVQIEQLEMPLPSNSSLAAIGEALGDLRLCAFWETPAEETIALLAEQNRSIQDSPFGFKLRTGGVTADAFPSSAQIARALVASAKSKVPIKFTAGLHHPIRMFRAEVKTKMHGFLNVLGAGVLALEHSWEVEQAVAMLDDEDPKSFFFDHEFFGWRDWQIASAKIAAHRKFVTSFGSCSFDEPREDLRALGFL